MNFLYTLIISPIENIIIAIFYFIRCFFSEFGVVGAIAGVSLAVNFLALPIYNIADAQQKVERETKRKLSPWVSRIRKTFRGDERFMMLSAYYRENHYHPAYALRETASILIQIPFFIAAYNFLRNCGDLKGATFGLIKDLGVPDALFSWNGMHLNVLPILMTIVNIVSGIIYTKDSPLREKLQAPTLALLFLFLLYDSPSGLVLYWTLNNIFGLVKNTVKEYCSKPWLAVEGVVCIVCLAAVVYVDFIRTSTRLPVKILFLMICLAFSLVIPLGNRVLKKRPIRLTLPERQCKILFIISCMAMTLLLGLALPSSMISSSPEEFTALGNTSSPLSYVFSSFVFAAGMCLLWPVCIFCMTSKGKKPFLSFAMSFLVISAILNVWGFKHDYGFVMATGELNNWGQINTPLSLAAGTLVSYTIVFLALLFFFLRRNCLTPLLMMISVCAALGLLTSKKIHEINTYYQNYTSSQKYNQMDEFTGVSFQLSKNKKNVFVIFLDKSMGVFVPYIFSQFPELAENYDGFVFYPNTVSFGRNTAEGCLALYGGYEYSPDMINKRPNELLNTKWAEAQRVLPKIFSGAGYTVTVTDPMFYNENDVLAKGLLKDIPNSKELITRGRFNGRYKKEHRQSDNQGIEPDVMIKKGIPRFFIFQALPPFLRFFYYAIGLSYKYSGSLLYGNFLDWYSTLYYLDELTNADESSSGTYTVLYNLTTHDIMPLMEPDYHPDSYSVTIESHKTINSPYPYQRDTLDNKSDLVLYECNAAALLQIGKWLEKLKALGVYDNTRIIIVGDHGYPCFPRFQKGFSVNEDYGAYHTLLMVKDFDSRGEFQTDKKFMTNADTAFISLEGLGFDMTNPYTGNKISDGTNIKANGINVFEFLDYQANFRIHNTQFSIDVNKAYHVSDDIYKESNWIPLADWLKEHPEDIPEGVIGRAAK